MNVVPYCLYSAGNKTTTITYKDKHGHTRFVDNTDANAMLPLSVTRFTTLAFMKVTTISEPFRLCNMYTFDWGSQMIYMFFEVSTVYVSRCIYKG